MTHSTRRREGHCLAWHTPHHTVSGNLSMQPLQNQAWTSRHLLSKLPYIQIQLSVDVDCLWRLTPCCSSHLEAVRKVLLPIDSRLHPILRVQKALPGSDFLTSLLQAMLNAADYTEQDSMLLTKFSLQKASFLLLEVAYTWQQYTTRPGSYTPAHGFQILVALCWHVCLWLDVAESYLRLSEML